MKKILFGLAIFAILFSGCDKFDKLVDKVKHKYKEFLGKDRGKRPFDIVYQAESDPKNIIISSSCGANSLVDYIYFQNQTQATRNYHKVVKYSTAPNSLRPFWDIRYVNPVSAYVRNSDGSHYANHSIYTGLDARRGDRNFIAGTPMSQTDPSGSVVESKCVGGALTEGTTLNLFDAPEQSLTYAGVQSSFVYNINPNQHILPWNSNKSGNLMLQAHFDEPLYFNYANNEGGSVSFNFILKNRKNGKYINYVIGVYAVGDAWVKEKAGIKFDPTTNIVHVATVIDRDSWWSTISPKSKSITEFYNTPGKTTKDDGVWPNFFRVNVSYNNLLAVLRELKNNPPANVAGQDFGLSPQDWELRSVMVQYELEENGGKASLSGSFRGFEVYTSKNPL